ncbi:transmembrane channel-like protein 3 [Trichonephila clavipes]|nr:transmembrane channel-like protein 3 [Trichonephila clavipes]
MCQACGYSSNNWILLLYLLNLYTLIFALFAKVYKTTNELQDLAKNITEMIDAQNSSVRHTRSLLEAIGSVDETESTTLLSPYNCTYIIIHNCTLAAFYAGINLTDYLVTTSTTQPNASSIDGDYFLDNSTSEDDLAYDNLIGNIANLTAFGMASWNVSSSAPVGPHIALPPVFFNVSSALDLEEGKMTWDIPLDYVSENASQAAKIANGVYVAHTVIADYVQFWFRRFRSGIFDVKNAPRTGRPVVKNADKITEIIKVDRHLGRLKLAIDQKRPKLANRRGVVFHQDNSRPHTYAVTRQNLWELGWKVLMHPPYSPGLAPMITTFFSLCKTS